MQHLLKLRSKSNSSFLYIGAGGIISLLILVSTIVLINQNQDTRSRAAYFTECSEYTPNNFVVNTDRQSVLAQLNTNTRTVREVAQSRRKSNAPAPSEFKESMQKRKEALILAMRVNPKAALANILNASDQTEIQLISENCVEKQTELEGTLDAYVIDYEDDTSETVYELKTSGNRTVRIHPTQQLGIQSNTKIKFRGYSLDNEMLVDTSNTSNYQILGQTPESQILAQSISHAFGSQKLAVILVKFQSSPNPPFTQSQLNSLVFNTINNYYKEVSYNQVSLTGSTFGWYTIPDQSECNTTTINNIMGSAFNAAKDAANFQDYERFIVFAYNISPLGCPFDGVGSVGKANLTLPDGTVNGSWALSTIKNNTGTTALQSLIAGHELGHNFGAGHAKTMNCGSVPLAASGCSIGSEYGDVFNIMGNDFVHMSAPHKEYIGWLPASKIQTVTSSGVYSIGPIESDSAGIKAIKIPRGNGDFLFIENREKIGLDSNLGRGKTTDIYNGALVHILQGAHETGLIDFSPPIAIPIEYSPALLPGSSFTDPVSKATIKVLNKSAGALSVEVLMSGDQSTVTPTETTSPPITTTVTGSPSVTTTIPASSISLQFSVTLPGIGSRVGDNKSPKRNSRIATIAITNLSGQVLEERTGTLTFDSATYSYKAQIPVGVPAGQYFVKIKLDNTLYKNSGQVVSLTAGVNQIAPVELVLGDLDRNNEVNMQDYSIFVSCFGNKQCSQKSLTDFNDDGKIDGVDYNILLRSFAIQQGD